MKPLGLPGGPQWGGWQTDWRGRHAPKEKRRTRWTAFAPDTTDDAGPDGIRCDREGRLYVATRLGVQVYDQAGRVNLILPTPNRRVVNLVFGGEKFDTPFATCGDKVFKRKLHAIRANAWDTPNQPPKPQL